MTEAHVNGLKLCLAYSIRFKYHTYIWVTKSKYLLRHRPWCLLVLEFVYFVVYLLRGSLEIRDKRTLAVKTWTSNWPTHVRAFVSDSYNLQKLPVKLNAWRDYTGATQLQVSYNIVTTRGQERLHFSPVRRWVTSLLGPLVIVYIMRSQNPHKLQLWHLKVPSKRQCAVMSAVQIGPMLRHLKVKYNESKICRANSPLPHQYTFLLVVWGKLVLN